MRLSWIVCLLGVVVLLPGVGAHAEADFHLERAAGEWVFSSPHPGLAGFLEQEEPGERYVWLVSTQGDRDRLVGEVVVPAGHFDVERPRQVRPEADGGLFTEPRSPAGVDEGVNPHRVLNITLLQDGGFVYRLGFPVDEGTGQVELSLTRDVEPPLYTVGEVRNVTHNSFYVETSTLEPALGVLWVRPAGAQPGEAVEHRTTTASLLQRFPTVGLQPGTEYVFHVELRDWSGNLAVSPTFNFTTLPLVVGPSPQILGVTPEPDAVLSQPPQAIEASFDPVAGEITRGGVRLFVDLEEVTSGVTVSSSSMRYVPPEPFQPGLHVVRLELMNSERGETFQRWVFTIEESGESVAPPLVVFLLCVAVAVVSLRTRSKCDPGVATKATADP